MTHPSITEHNNGTSEEMDNCRTTIKRHSNGSPSNDLTSGSVLMGKLGRRVLTLIKHKVSADGSVSDCMAQALTTWLRQRGITIYTEAELKNSSPVRNIVILPPTSLATPALGYSGVT
jgi:hypothetical protein